MATGNLNITVKDQQSDPIEGVLVRLYDGSNDTLISSASTDNQGKAYFVPEAGDYVIRVYKPGVLFDGLLGPGNNHVQAVTVIAGQDNDYTVTGRIPTGMESTDPRFCLVYGTLKSATGELVSGKVSFYRKNGAWASDGDVFINVESEQIVDVVDGRLSVSLLRLSEYRMYIGRSRVAEFWVPDAPGASLDDLILPYPVSVTFDPPSLTMLPGQHAWVSVDVRWSDGHSRPLTETFTVSVDQETIATVSLDESEMHVYSYPTSGSCKITLRPIIDYRDVQSYTYDVAVQ